MMPLPGTRAFGAAGRALQRHAAEACGVLTIFGLASGLSAGFGGVIERLDFAETQSCAPSQPVAVKLDTFEVAPRVASRHVVDVSYEEQLAITMRDEYAAGTCDAASPPSA